jgi:hypothetical protein
LDPITHRENHWNGALLDSIEAALQFARTMTWQGIQPVVALGTTTYPTGVKLTKEMMDRGEAPLERLPHLGTWFVDIVCPPSVALGYLMMFASLRR